MLNNPLTQVRQKRSPKPSRLAIQVSGHSLWQWRRQAIADLSHGQERSLVSDLGQELDWLLLEVSNLTALDLRLERVETQPVELCLSFAALQKLWQQRLQQRVPVQHLTGTAHWRHLHLKVSKNVLIPRPETELLIDLAIAAVSSPSGDASLWADLGTGSGAISLALAAAFSKATIHAVDCSEMALEIAWQNCQTYHLQDRIHLRLGQWCDPLLGLESQFQGIVSNPPYIPTEILPTLQPEVVDHEPHLALDGGADGLAAIREIVAIAPTYLQSGGVLLLEMMSGQDQAVEELLIHQGQYHQVQIHPDLAGIPRFAQAFRI